MKLWHIAYSTNRDWSKGASVDTYSNADRYLEQFLNMKGHFSTKTVSFLHCYSVTFEPGKGTSTVETLFYAAHNPPKILELNTDIAP